MRRARRKILDDVIEHYVTSGDFNGLALRPSTLTQRQLRHVRRLVADGHLQVVSEADFINPHIRPWASKRSVEDQVADVDNLSDTMHLCLYPTPAAMAGRAELETFLEEPYRHRLASGRGTLDLAYFTVDVIEQYRNDPRYHYWSSDFEVHFGIGDDAYLDEDEPDRDKVASLRVGFAYDETTIRSDKVKRYACAFVGDLAKFTPEHQQRWRTYEVEPNESTHAHPVWWAMQGGHWPDGMGPFERIVGELEAINELFEIAYGARLFRTTDRPREWGWVLRPSTQEWHQFLLATDKLLSDNLSHDALSATGVDRRTPEGDPAGTLLRLRWYLEKCTPTSPETIDGIVEPLRSVRAERQKPAHALVVPTTDATLTAQQRDCLHDVAQALFTLRQVLELHPKTREVWSTPHHLEGTEYVV